eukprot:3942333-Prorocentrum_lima.AAC.1
MATSAPSTSSSRAPLTSSRKGPGPEAWCIATVNPLTRSNSLERGWQIVRPLRTRCFPGS